MTFVFAFFFAFVVMGRKVYTSIPVVCSLFCLIFFSFFFVLFPPSFYSFVVFSSGGLRLWLLWWVIPNHTLNLHMSRSYVSEANSSMDSVATKNGMLDCFSQTVLALLMGCILFGQWWRVLLRSFLKFCLYPQSVLRRQRWKVSLRLLLLFSVGPFVHICVSFFCFHSIGYFPFFSLMFCYFSLFPFLKKVCWMRVRWSKNTWPATFRQRNLCVTLVVMGITVCLFEFTPLLVTFWPLLHVRLSGSFKPGWAVWLWSMRAYMRPLEWVLLVSVVNRRNRWFAHGLRSSVMGNIAFRGLYDCGCWWEDTCAYVLRDRCFIRL